MDLWPPQIHPPPRHLPQDTNGRAIARPLLARLLLPPARRRFARARAERSSARAQRKRQSERPQNGRRESRDDGQGSFDGAFGGDVFGWEMSE